MALVDPPAEIAILHYPGAQLSALHELTDVFGIASDQSRLMGGATAPMLRVSHWCPDTAAGPVAKTFDTHPRLANRPTVAIAGPSLRDLPQDRVMLGTLGAWLQHHHREGCVVCSVCSGAYLLARAGLLDGRPATLHWCHAADFAQKFPAVRIDTDSLLVDDGDIITAGAVTAWTDLGLRIVNRLPDVKPRRLLVPRGAELAIFARRCPARDHLTKTARLLALKMLGGRGGWRTAPVHLRVA